MSPPRLVVSSFDQVDGMLGLEQGMAGHAAPGGEVRWRARALRHYLECLAWADVEQTAAKLEDELSASHLTGVPSLHRDDISTAVARRVKLGGMGVDSSTPSAYHRDARGSGGE